VLLGPTPEATIAARYLTPHAVHKAMAATGGIAIAAAARLAGTVAAEVARAESAETPVSIAHPSGVMELGISAQDGDVQWASVLRTTRRIFEGTILIPRRIWAGPSRQVAMAAE
jgi:2-methylaconitate cis-trans-isomerase PrpF